MKKEKIGEINLENTIDVTDPCYNKTIWCRINDIKIAQGNYTCYVWRKTIHDRDLDDYDENARIGIYKNNVVPRRSEMVRIGSVGVDSGLVGFFPNKPDYSEKQWREFCREIDKDQNKYAWINNDGFFGYTAYGDGCFDVYTHKNKDGNVDALEISVL